MILHFHFAGYRFFPVWTTKNLCAAGCNHKRQTDKSQIIIWSRLKRGNHFTDFWDMKAFSHPDFTAKNYNKILYRRTCEWKRKMTWQPKEKKEDKTKDYTVVPHKDRKGSTEEVSRRHSWDKVQPKLSAQLWSVPGAARTGWALWGLSSAETQCFFISALRTRLILL